MAHLLRILTDAKLKRGVKITGQNLADIDENTKKGINGDGGGTWSPSTQIQIAGAGAVIAGPWTMLGAGVTVTTAVNKPILFGKGDATDYFGLDPAHPGASPTPPTRFCVVNSTSPEQSAWGLTGVTSLALGARFHTPISVYSGAPKIDSIDVSFKVAFGSHLPQVLPKMRVFAVAIDGTVIPLRAKDATTDIDGFQFFPTPANGAAWYAAGVVQTWTYTCTVVLPVDSAAYEYFAEFVDESGASAHVGNLYIGAIVRHSLVTIFDGRN